MDAPKSFHPCHNLTLDRNSHVNQKVFLCRHCMMAFADPIVRWHHSKNCTGRDSVITKADDTDNESYCVDMTQDDLTCPICRRKFETQKELRTHVINPCSKPLSSDDDFDELPIKHQKKNSGEYDSMVSVSVRKADVSPSKYITSHSTCISTDNVAVPTNSMLQPILDAANLLQFHSNSVQPFCTVEADTSCSIFQNSSEKLFEVKPNGNEQNTSDFLTVEQQKPFPDDVRSANKNWPVKSFKLCSILKAANNVQSSSFPTSELPALQTNQPIKLGCPTSTRTLELSSLQPSAEQLEIQDTTNRSPSHLLINPYQTPYRTDNSNSAVLSSYQISDAAQTAGSINSGNIYFGDIAPQEETVINSETMPFTTRESSTLTVNSPSTETVTMQGKNSTSRGVGTIETGICDIVSTTEVKGLNRDSIMSVKICSNKSYPATQDDLVCPICHRKFETQKAIRSHVINPCSKPLSFYDDFGKLPIKQKKSSEYDSIVSVAKTVGSPSQFTKFAASRSMCSSSENVTVPTNSTMQPMLDVKDMLQYHSNCAQTFSRVKEYISGSASFKNNSDYSTVTQQKLVTDDNRSVKKKLSAELCSILTAATSVHSSSFPTFGQPALQTNQDLKFSHPTSARTIEMSNLQPSAQQSKIPVATNQNSSPLLINAFETHASNSAVQISCGTQTAESKHSDGIFFGDIAPQEETVINSEIMASAPQESSILTVNFPLTKTDAPQNLFSTSQGVGRIESNVFDIVPTDKPYLKKATTEIEGLNMLIEAACREAVSSISKVASNDVLLDSAIDPLTCPSSQLNVLENSVTPCNSSGQQSSSLITVLQGNVPAYSSTDIALQTSLNAVISGHDAVVYDTAGQECNANQLSNFTSCADTSELSSGFVTISDNLQELDNQLIIVQDRESGRQHILTMDGFTSDMLSVQNVIFVEEHGKIKVESDS